jgi:hypothetical protein
LAELFFQQSLSGPGLFGRSFRRSKNDLDGPQLGLLNIRLSLSLGFLRSFQDIRDVLEPVEGRELLLERSECSRVLPA